jgi:hypothetical protein
MVWELSGRTVPKAVFTRNSRHQKVMFATVIPSIGEPSLSQYTLEVVIIVSLTNFIAINNKIYQLIRNSCNTSKG